MTNPANETPASHSPPAVLTAAQRHDLARQFERAKQLAGKNPPDFAGVHRVLAEVCTLDPGNTLFVAALLENLQRAGGKTNTKWFWQVWKLAAELDQARQNKQWTRALRAGWELLGETPSDVAVLGKLAQICESLDHCPTQIVLLRTARRFAPKDTEVLRPLALALCAAGQFKEATETWQQLREEIPYDPEAQKYLGILQPDKQHPISGGADLAERVRNLLAAKLWDEAEQLLAAESGTVGANLELRWLGEELSVRRAVDRYRIACELERIRESKVMQQLVADMQDERRRIELGVAFARYERFPSEPKSLWDLGSCLMATRNFSEALKYLERIRGDAEWGQAALVAIAAAWQHLRQFDRALVAYREVIGLPDFVPDEIDDTDFEDALYHGAILAQAMGESATATAWLERLIAVKPRYKDAAARLDNLRSICHKGGFPAEPHRDSSRGA